jgi:CRISPR-associated protein Cas5t
MLKAIRLIAYQNLVNYRKPASIAIQDSYKLPPYSTVIGMIHNACGFDNYHPMKISISGRYATSVSDMYIRYFPTNSNLEKDKDGFSTRYQLYVNESKGMGLGGRVVDLSARKDFNTEGRKGIIRSLGHYELLVDVELVIHIVPENGRDYDIILNGLRKPAKYLSLGRHEDLIRIDDVSMADIIQHQDKSVEEDDPLVINYDTLVPMNTYKEYSMNFTGSVCVMNKVFATKDSKGKALPLRQIKERISAKIVKAKSLMPPNIPHDIINNELVGVFLA